MQREMSKVNYCILLRRRHLLNSEGIVEKTVAGEVLLDVLLDELDTKIRVVNTFDLVADTTNEFVGLPRVVDEFTRGQARIASAREHGGSLVQRTTESASDCQNTGGQRRDQVLSSTCGDYRVHRARDGGSMVGGQH